MRTIPKVMIGNEDRNKKDEKEAVTGEVQNKNKLEHIPVYGCDYAAL